MTDDTSMTSPQRGNDSDDDWYRYAHYVLKELEASQTRDLALDKKIDELVRLVTALKERSGWVGFLGGLFPALGFVLWQLLKKPG
jgi:hypothetical protein